MTKYAIPYLQCYGLTRLVLHCAASLTRNGTLGTEVPVGFVSEHCGSELEARKQQVPALGNLGETLRTYAKVQWLGRRSERLRLTETGWWAFGGDNPGQSLAPMAASAEPAAKPAPVIVTESLTKGLSCARLSCARPVKRLAPAPCRSQPRMAEAQGRTAFVPEGCSIVRDLL